MLGAPTNPGKNQPSRCPSPGTENFTVSGRPGKLSILISLLERCGFTMRYTSNPAIAEVATTTKNSNATTAKTIFVYQRDGNRNSLRMDIRNRATGLAHSPFLIPHPKYSSSSHAVSPAHFVT